ncbi:hypothetical protein ACFPFP_38560 [Bradyrhizobium sp. GCM10023182]|uniref:General secretion pathway protein GspN n=1 Tax=Bradyrhizobium zhengyangense TaxID=2911009 RepID=A0ABS9M0M6_9BRAD|nr:hypothetical protein [Bradyrhizobium zhengyangense]MCG2672816.1 hypothetical protein [Bradyrhizobium zhengyangense]
MRNDFPSRRELMAITPPRRGLLIGLVALIGVAVVTPVATIIALEIAVASQSTWEGRGTAAPARQESRIGSYENILQRPLFSRNRQSLPTTPAPATAEAVAPTRMMLDPSVALRGVFMDGERAKAFLTSSENPVGIWIALNEQWSGWRLSEVKPNVIVLEADGERQSLPLTVLK